MKFTCDEDNVNNTMKNPFFGKRRLFRVDGSCGYEICMKQ